MLLTAGGTIISAAFQIGGHIRDERNQAARLEHANFVQLKQQVDFQITKRITPLRQIVLLLNSCDLSGAKRVRESTYAETVREWNFQLNGFLQPIKSLDDDASPPPPLRVRSCKGFLSVRTSKKVEALTKPSAKGAYGPNLCGNSLHDCLVGATSIHFAFKEASRTLGVVMDSEWARCLELSDYILGQQVRDCKKKSLPPESRQLFPRLECLDLAYKQHQFDIEKCKWSDGYSLVRVLNDELQQVSDLWDSFDIRFSELEKKKYGSVSPPAGQTSQ